MTVYIVKHQGEIVGVFSSMDGAQIYCAGDDRLYTITIHNVR